MRYWIPLILFTLVFSVEAKQRVLSEREFFSPSPYDYRYKALRFRHFLAHMEIYQKYPEQLDHLSVHFPSLNPDEYDNYVTYLLNLAEESSRAKRRGLKEIYCSSSIQLLGKVRNESSTR
jgi:hypothetical protein